MKRFEIILGIGVLVALFFKVLHFPGGSLLLTITLMGLACIYLFWGFALFNNVSDENAFNKSAYSGISTQQIMFSIVAALALSAVCIGILFKIQHWPGAVVILLSGLIAVFVVGIIALIKYLGSKSDFYKMILLRIAIIGVVGLFCFFAKIFCTFNKVY